MISAKQAAQQVKKAYPKLTVTMVLDYDDKHFVVEAVESTKETDYNAPYYGVEKSSGKVTCFTPAEDFDKFFDALDNREVPFE